jgi:hypothetical protein
MSHEQTLFILAQKFPNGSPEHEEMIAAAAHIVTLQTALQPFAELADSYSATFGDDLQISTRESEDGDSTYAFTLGDLRRADQALNLT